MNERVMKQSNDLTAWWHGVAMLPANRDDHAYHALRRVWGDHTMAGGRGFYRTTAEDHITPTLFQHWSIWPDASWVTTLVGEIGGTANGVKRVRWAYECNETLDLALRQFHGRDFIIPDIILCYEDAEGLAIVACETKKPGGATDRKDARKLESYMNLASLRNFARRYGCVIVSERSGERSRSATGGQFPILSWERLRDLQIQDVENLGLSTSSAFLIRRWIAHNYACYGVGEANLVPPSMGQDYGSMDAYAAIDALSLPPSITRFLKGSECAEAVRRGHDPAPPLPWLTDEPTREMIATRGRLKPGWQTNSDRHLCRWSFDWTVSKEAVWK